ncbi:DUF4136 domain-containing protein [Ekhidna sp. To15]|uniref:DUF4136 domain-containing protein n=1 Tax=Ekhidna sp. To15 TaxID=3395267 RepID=UPI003F523665
MKALVFGIVCFLICSCSRYDYVVESDYSYSGKFNRYKTFGFGTNQGFAGDSEDKVILEKSVRKVLQAWGYKYNEKKPDLVVVYTIFFDDVNLKGFSQPQFQTWLTQNFISGKVLIRKDSLDEQNSDYRSSVSLREEYNEKEYDLKEGTILVSFYDRKRKGTVWQGYASGVFSADEQKNERIMRSAVIQILDEYKLVAFKSNS